VLRPFPLALRNAVVQMTAAVGQFADLHTILCTCGQDGVRERDREREREREKQKRKPMASRARKSISNVIVLTSQCHLFEHFRFLQSSIVLLIRRIAS